MLLRSKGEKIFAVFNYILMTFLAFITLYPMWHVFMSSISDPSHVLADRGIYLWFKGTPNIKGYILVLRNPNISVGYINTLFYVTVGTAFSMLSTILGAYALSRRGLYWNRFIMRLIVFTMYFQGGLMPLYIQMRSFGMLDTRWAVLLPVMVGTMNLIILRTAFVSAPESLVESAKLDGASEWRIVWQIIVPVAKAAVSVILLFYAVMYWNAWFYPSIFLNTRALWPMQLVLREILIQGDTTAMVDMSEVGQAGIEHYRLLVKYTTIIIATLPVLAIYPFIQKYFVTGVMIGSLKE